jgi:L-ribulokinase
LTLKDKFSIGIDFGANSLQTVLVNIATGEEAASATYKFPHGIITDQLPGTDISLDPGWALHHPDDYLIGLKRTVPNLLRMSGISSDQIIGIGIDFQGSTVIPTTDQGKPLAVLEEYRDEPHAWPMMWEHLAAQNKATLLTQLATDRFEPFLDRYGGQINAEWFFPKVWQIQDENLSIYHAADRLIEATDWVVWQLTGEETRNLSAAGYKALWSKSEGFPLEPFFAAMDDGLTNVIDNKMKREILPLGQKAGELTEDAAKWLNLKPGTTIATGMIGPQTAVPAASIAEPGKMALVLGSVFKLLVLSKKEYRVPGMSGMVEDGIVPGLIGFEAEQAGGSNHYNWFINNGIPGEYLRVARKQKISIHKLIEEKAQQLEPAESGLVALDWWNGNRSILADKDLTGLILGYSLATKPEEIYRALVEATAFGTRKIFETFIASGVPINEIIIVPNNSCENPLLYNILANVTRMEIKIADSSHPCALGSAIYAAVAAGKENGGYDVIQDAVRKMARLKEKTYIPNNNDKKTYNRVYSEFTLLHDYFGYGHNNAMKRLRNLRESILDKKKRIS